MSNKSRLQTNNTNLQALIAKANALPNAGTGGSSGGGSIETCTGTMTFKGIPVPNMATIYYVDKDLQLRDKLFEDGATFTCMKNSIIYITDWSSMSIISGNITEINYSQLYGAYFVTGDFTLLYE